MKKLLFLLTLAAPALAQGFQNASIQTNQPKQPGSATTTLRVTTNLVVVDVVVTDKDHHAIHGLKQNDFALLEDKVAQPIKSFEEHTSAEIGGSLVPMPVLPAGVFTNFTPVPGKGPLNILLLDKLDTAPKDQSKLRTELLKYIDTAKPGTRIALFELGDRLRLLQGFTDDREMLRAALEKDLPMRPYLSDSMNRPGRSPREDWCPPPIPGGPDLCPEILWNRSRQRSVNIAQVMRALALYLSGIPGRKNLLWYSGNFPLYFLLQPGAGHYDFPPGDASLMKEFRQAADILAANQVAVYPIDARGLTVSQYNEIGEPMGMGVDFDRRTNRQEFGSMTGGRAFVDTNYLDQITAEAIEDGSNYYTLAYTPANSNWNGDYRKIEVKLADGRTAELSYRRGYYANDPNHPVKTSIFGHASLAKDTRPDPMHMALMLGVPEATQIVFVAHPALSAAKAEDVLATGNEGSKGLKGPYQRYGLHLAVDPHTLMLMESSDGVHHGAVEFVTLVYDQNGSVVNSVGRTAHVDLKRGVYEQVLRGGLPLEMEVTVPVKGEYTLRIAVHDLNNDHVGAIEIPVSSVRNLPPAQVSVSATTPSPK